MLRTAIACLTGIVLVLTPALAQAEGWSLNPFGAKPARKSSPPLTTRVAAGTRKMVGGAVDLVTLKPVRQALAPKPAKQSGWQGYQPQFNSQKPQPSKPSIFGNWFNGKNSHEEPPKRANNSWLFDEDRSHP